MLRISELKLKIEEEESSLIDKIIQYLHIKKEELIEFHIVKQSLDARKKDQIYFSYIVDIELKNEEKILKNKRIKVTKVEEQVYTLPSYQILPLEKRPIVVGFGPSGMFASLFLAKMGLKPIVFERGSAVETRIEDVKEFWNTGKLKTQSNIQFGEGGAGTFSDGKLTTRVKDVRSDFILKEFVDAGAPNEILYVHNPHIGTDILVKVVKNIREKIISLGGEIHFDSLVEDIEMKNHHTTGLKVNGKYYEANDVILAIGHSARDTFQMLYERKVSIEQKAFAVGVRIEHPQRLINKAQFGEKYMNHPKLKQAEYRLTHRASNGKSVYTFCMCPGGTVVPSSSELNSVVVNGMSEYNRDQENANSALVCTVDETDFGSSHPLAGMEFQRHLEQLAFESGGKSYRAPAQLVKDFLENTPSKASLSVKPSYALGVTFTNLNALFNEEILKALKEAIHGMNQKLQGFSYPDAVLTGVETRTSSPVRLPRSETNESINVSGLYPCGEGAGYAGGIMSAAIDGMKTAEKMVEKYKK